MKTQCSSHSILIDWININQQSVALSDFSGWIYGLKFMKSMVDIYGYILIGCWGYRFSVFDSIFQLELIECPISSKVLPILINCLKIRDLMAFLQNMYSICLLWIYYVTSYTNIAYYYDSQVCGNILRIMGINFMNGFKL